MLPATSIRLLAPLESLSRLREALARSFGHRQVNDAYLVALAVSHTARIVTFDRPLAALAGDPRVVEVLT